MAAEQKSVRDQIAEFFAEMFGSKGGAAKKEFGEADAQRLVEAAIAPLKAENSDLKKKLDEQAASFAERERKLSAGEHSGRVAEAVNKLRSAGKWVPAFEKMGLKAVFGELAKLNDTIEFGEGDAKKKLPALDVMVDFIEQLPKFGPQPGAIVGGRTVNHGEAKATPSRLQADANSQQLNELAKKRQEEKKISFGEALTQVATEHPELTQPGAAIGGQV